MQKIDIAIVVLGAVVLASAVAGAVLYEPDAQGRTFDVDWTADTAELDAKSDSVSGSGEVEFSFDVTQANVTTSTFSVDVQAGGGHVSQDDITVNVTSPDGSTVEETGSLASGSSSASVEATLDVATIPSVDTVQATDKDAALRQLTEDHGTEANTGTWTVTVTVDHGGALGGEHDITVTPEVGFYEAQVAQSGPDVRGN